MKSFLKKLIPPLILLSPAFIILFVFKVLPIIFAFRLSFYDWGIAGIKGFVGLKNYYYLLKDPFFWQSVINTIYYTIFAVPLNIIISLFIAYLLNRGIKALGLFRTIYFLPVITSIVAVSVVWKWLYDPNRGLFNYFLTLAGFHPLKWLEEPRGIFELIFGVHLPYILRGPSLALFSLVLMSVWKSLGYNVVIFLAGLKNIPDVYYEAARIDGAGMWQTFRNVTIPLLSPTTSVIVYYLYQKGFEEYQVGYGSAIAFVFFLMILAITLFQKLYLEKKVYYEV